MGSSPTLGRIRADSSVVERLAYTEEVVGSNPASPTIIMGSWCSGLTRQPVTLETGSSNLLDPAFISEVLQLF